MSDDRYKPTKFESMVPEKYTQDGILVETVGDLKKALEKLPDDLPIHDYPTGGILKVYNINWHNPHMVLEEFEDEEPLDFDEDEDEDEEEENKK